MTLPVLMSHQEEGVAFLASHNGCGLLGWEPGVGKTLTALEYIRRTDAFPLLVIAPVFLLGMWKAEIQRWYGWDTVTLRDTPKMRREAYKAAQEGKNPRQTVYLIGYETFRQDKISLSSLPVRACIADESGKARTPTAKISKALRMFLPPVRIALDGTPVSNSIADLWSPVEWIAPRALMGNWWAFRKTFAIMNPYIPGKVDGWREQDKIITTANKHIMWVKKEDVLKDLPPLTMQDIPLEPSDEERTTYKKIKEELRVIINEEEMSIPNALALLMRLRQAANGAWDDKPSKITATIDLIEALPPDEKVVIFTQFETVVQQLLRALPYPCVAITGAHSTEERETALHRFEHDPAVRVLVMTSAGERGNNIQCASFMIQYDLPWSNASQEQRIGRIWRHGQLKPCLVYNLLMQGTVDMHMKRILERKQALAESVLTKEDIKKILL